MFGAIGDLQACLSSVALLLPVQWEVHIAAFSSVGSFRASLSLSEPATDFQEIGRNV